VVWVKGSSGCGRGGSHSGGGGFCLSIAFGGGNAVGVLSSAKGRSGLPPASCRGFDSLGHQG